MLGPRWLPQQVEDGLFSGAFAGTDSASACSGVSEELIKAIRHALENYHANVHSSLYLSVESIAEDWPKQLSRGCCRLLASHKHHDRSNEHPHPKRENVAVDDIEKQGDRCHDPEPGEPSREYTRSKDHNGSC
jgi:hypothetical protein